jgi:hypothetical protein
LIVAHNCFSFFPDVFMIMIFNHSNFVVRILHSEHPEPQEFCVPWGLWWRVTRACEGACWLGAMQRCQMHQTETTSWKVAGGIQASHQTIHKSSRLFQGCLGKDLLNFLQAFPSYNSGRIQSCFVSPWVFGEGLLGLMAFSK